MSMTFNIPSILVFIQNNIFIVFIVVATLCCVTSLFLRQTNRLEWILLKWPKGQCLLYFLKYIVIINKSWFLEYTQIKTFNNFDEIL